MNNSPIINNKSFSDDEIDIRGLFKVVWDGKGLIVALTALFTIAAVIFSLSLPNIYQSKALLSPVGEEGGSNQSMKNLGGLASLAGFNLPNQGGANSIKAMEKLRTFSFFKDNILPNIFLPDLMALESWDADNNVINYNPNLYNSEQQTWTEIPSPQKSYKVFMESLNLSKNFDTGSVTIIIKHQSPYIAKEWAEIIVNQLNNFFRSKDKQEAQAAMNFLNAQIAQTSLSEIKQVIAQLLQQKIQTLTLIEANEFYVFSYLDPPMVMEEKIEPSRSSISILGAILGGMLGLLFVIIRQYFINRSI